MSTTIKKELDYKTVNAHDEEVHCVVIKDDLFIMNRSGDRIELEGCDEWKRRLRSGEYKQGKEQLMLNAARGMEYCCLGVFCEMKGMMTRELSDGVYCFLYKGTSSWTNIPSGFIDDTEASLGEAGSLNGTVYYNGKVCNNLAALNDVGMSFDEIADVIEFFFKEK